MLLFTSHSRKRNLMLNSLLYLLPFLVSSSLCHAKGLSQLRPSKDDTPITIDAETSVVCDETKQNCMAIGNAKAQKGTNTVYGDVLTVYFKEGKDREITHITADGHVRMESPTETAYGEHAHYDVKLDRILMTGGNLKIVTQKEILTARDSIEYWHAENKGIARGNAVATFPEKKEVVQGNTLVAYFKSSKGKSENNEEKLALERVEAEGKVLASGPKGVVTGDKGIYFANTHLVEVFGNVKVTQEGNVIKGEYGRHNLKTDVAEISPYVPGTSQRGPTKRISGIIYPKDAKKMKEKKFEAKETESAEHEGGHVFPSSVKNNLNPSL